MTNEELKAMVVSELKENGLDIAEDMAIAAVKVILGIIPKVAIATENKWDDLCIPMLAVLEPAILKELDKIDGKVEVVA